MRPSAYDGEETPRRLVGTARLQDLHHVWGWRARLLAPATERSLGRSTRGSFGSAGRAARAGPAWPGPRRLAHYINSGPACTGG